MVCTSGFLSFEANGTGNASKDETCINPTWYSTDVNLHCLLTV